MIGMHNHYERHNCRKHKLATKTINAHNLYCNTRSTSNSQSEAANKIMKYVEAAKGRQIKKKGKSFIEIPDNFVIKFPCVY